MWKHDKSYVGKTVKRAYIGPESYQEELRLICDDGTVVRIVDEGQSCCEHRYITCDDDLSCLIGGTLIDIVVKDVDMDSEDEDDWGVHEITFVEVQTTKGCVTIETHNEHNGYYGGFLLNVHVTEAGSCA